MRSTPCMGRVIASPTPDLSPRRLRWSNRLSLRQRILAVNVFALLIVAGSVFYLDSYRARIIDERVDQIAREAQLISAALGQSPRERWADILAALGSTPNTRIRLAQNGELIADSWPASGGGWSIQDPARESWRRRVARWLDDGLDFIADARPATIFTEFAPPAQWTRGSGWMVARDKTHVVWATAPAPGSVLIAERNARDIRRLVRAERTRLGIILAGVTLMSILLSLFLARTIAEPLRSLANAAQRVRLGRDREVNVPRLPDRSDEIGLLARSLSDMTQALRARMDAVEAFAADVAHELKNPLASLSSATQALRVAEQPAVADQLRAIVDQDVIRLNRLISDISDLSRIDAQLARTRFQPVDLGKLIEELLAGRAVRGANGSVEIAYARPRAETALVNGDPAQLARVIENLLTNAVSFSPPEGVVRIAATRTGGEVLVTVDDDGPGIPEGAREAIFERFHTDRPEGEAFGKHSGLGLSIARTIVNGHDGAIGAQSREAGRQGARFLVRLPAVETEA